MDFITESTLERFHKLAEQEEPAKVRPAALKFTSWQRNLAFSAADGDLETIEHMQRSGDIRFSWCEVLYGAYAGRQLDVAAHALGYISRAQWPDAIRRAFVGLCAGGYAAAVREITAARLPDHLRLEGFQEACAQGRVEVAEQLIPLDHDEIKITMGIFGAVTKGHIGIVARFRGDVPPVVWVKDVLPLACEYGQEAVVEEILSWSEITIDAEDLSSALEEAVREKHDSVVHRLVSLADDRAALCHKGLLYAFRYHRLQRFRPYFESRGGTMTDALLIALRSQPITLIAGVMLERLGRSEFDLDRLRKIPLGEINHPENVKILVNWTQE